MGLESQRGKSELQNQLIRAGGQNLTRRKAMGRAVIPASVLHPCGRRFTWAAECPFPHPLGAECPVGGPGDPLRLGRLATLP